MTNTRRAKGSTQSANSLTTHDPKPPERPNETPNTKIPLQCAPKCCTNHSNCVTTINAC